MNLGESFHWFAQKVSDLLGSPRAFVVALGGVALWGLLGSAFSYSDSWQLVINTGTTILTFLAVFLIQNTQNRDNKAIQLKLDELIRAIKPARNRLLDLESLSDDELNVLQEQFRKLRERAEKK